MSKTLVAFQNRIPCITHNIPAFSAFPALSLVTNRKFPSFIYVRGMRINAGNTEIVLKCNNSFIDCCILEITLKQIQVST